MLLLLAVHSAALLHSVPAARAPPLARRSAPVVLSDPSDAGQTNAPAPTQWPKPARSVTELQEAQAAAKEAAEAEAFANPKPFVLEGGGFSVVAAVTVAVFVVGGTLFFQGITGSGAARFADDQPPEVKECIKRATTRSEASSCLPPVPLG